MTDMFAWAQAALVASSALMLLVLVLRAPARRLVGPRLAYALWLLPVLRMVLPPLPPAIFGGLPVAGDVVSGMSVLVTGPQGVQSHFDGSLPFPIGQSLLTIWLVGALAFFGVYAVRHWLYCQALRADCTELDRVGDIRIIASGQVQGPLAFGVFERFIAVPLNFTREYRSGERELAIAHESAHHFRGDLLANWISLAVLAAHWWNPIAWLAVRAFREDQEFAADALVLAGREPATRALYGQVLAKAAGVGALPACNLNANSNLKGRLMMIAQKPRSTRRLVFGGAMLALLGTAALATTAAAPVGSRAGSGKQAVTIAVKPDGSGSYALILGDTTVAPGASLPAGLTLPADFSDAGGCDLRPNAKPFAMVIKGEGATQTYTVICASAVAAPLRATLVEGVESLRTMRASVAAQPASSAFPEAERSHALQAIDRSIGEVEATLTAG